jgi:hypothetical protein
LETGENIKGDIVGHIRDLRFNQHKTIRQIAAATGKSSRIQEDIYQVCYMCQYKGAHYDNLYHLFWA